MFHKHIFPVAVFFLFFFINYQFISGSYCISTFNCYLQMSQNTLHVSFFFRWIDMCEDFSIIWPGFYGGRNVSKQTANKYLS